LRPPEVVILSPSALSEAKGLLFRACLRAGSAKNLLVANLFKQKQMLRFAQHDSTDHCSGNIGYTHCENGLKALGALVHNVPVFWKDINICLRRYKT